MALTRDQIDDLAEEGVFLGNVYEIAQAIEAEVRKQDDAPPCPRGQFAYTYQHPELGELVCHLEAEEGDESVGWPEQVTLCAAYLRGVDIADRLTSDEVEAIELATKSIPKRDESHIN